MIGNKHTNNKDKPWLVIAEGTNALIEMDNLDYLNHLLLISRKMIELNSKPNLRCLIWDLEEIIEEQPSFYKRYSLIIDSEIKALRRILSYSSIKPTV